MKHNITKSLLALVISLLALPMQSQDYLKIYFKDGHTERHYMHLVESISATKYDLEGNLHSDYQMQQIVMKDATYSYYLADIDSMSFKKVYEEQVKADVEQVSNTITPIFEQCATIEEMETHIDEMKAMDCVEDVWREGSDIVVQIRDWKKIFYKYPLVSDSDFSQILNSSTRNSENLLPIKSDGTPMKVGIAFQMVDDPRFDDEERALFILSNRFQQLGFDSHYIDVLDFDFFNKDIFNYDILFLATHGSYSKGKHYLYTSIKTDLKDDLLWEIANRELGSVGIDYDDISYSYCQTGEYLINFGTFIVISEDYIRRSQYNFTGPGPHVVFNAACSSLKGGNQLTRENDSETFRGNDSMAKVFFNKGADVYFGETNDSYNSRLAGLNLFYYMLDGASEECAYNQLDPDYKYESDSNDKSALIDLFNPNSKYDIKGLFLNSVQTEEKSVKEINDEYKTNGQIELKGKISPLLDINQGLTFGFRLSSEPDVDTSNEYETIKSTNADYSGRDFGEVTFSAVVDPEPGKTYYYRAYTFDGIHYNYGEPCTFFIDKSDEPDEPTSDKELMLSEKVNGVDYKIYKKIIDETDYHENPDGWKCYKSELSLETTANGNTQTIVLDNNIYLDDSKGHHGGQFPCMLIDYKSDRLVIFCNSKDADYQYSMEGYSYTSSLNNLNFSKEIVFTWANWGWYPFFEENSNGAPTLSHFSYAGYYAMQSTRNNNGSWDTAKKSSIRPDEFDSLSKQAGQVLVIGDNSGNNDNPGDNDTSLNPYCPDGNHPHMIDFGLQSGTLWACCNVGATKPEESGGYYAWGETETKDYYDWDSYSLCKNGDSWTCLDINDISGTQYDVAHVRWGGSWRMPNYDQLIELMGSLIDFEIETLNGVKGLKLKGKNGSILFMPMAGDMEKDSHDFWGGCYWLATQAETGTRSEHDPAEACVLTWEESTVTKKKKLNIYTWNKCTGVPVRACYAP